MSVHLFDGPIAGTPPEPLLLKAVSGRLIEDSERERFDQELATKHYVKSACAVGRLLRCVAEYQGRWVAGLTTDAAHLTKPNCRQLTQNNGADFFLFLKGNQPTALAKAEQLLPGADSPGSSRGRSPPDSALAASSP